jgi:hypothetical protein
MGLFSMLPQSSEAAAAHVSGAKKSSDALPTVVQLVSGSNWGNSTNKSTAGNSHPFAPLHYSAVRCSLDSSSYAPGGVVGLRHANKLKIDNNAGITPDLGIWTCRADQGRELVDALLPATVSNETLVLTVDAQSPERVEPSLTQQQEALVRHLIQHRVEGGDGITPNNKNEETATRTTSLAKLKTVQFGLAPESTHNRVVKAAEEADEHLMVTVQICVHLPAPPRDDDDKADYYKEQQMMSLLQYHLRKYAANLNASLIFVQPEQRLDGASERSVPQSGDSKQRQVAVSRSELNFVWKALAQGQAVWKYETIEELIEGRPVAPAREEHEGKDNEPEQSGYSLIYGPDNHNAELIDTVLLRAATYPGHWDASTESLREILPNAVAVKAETAVVSGDQGWLKELRDSVVSAAAAGLQTPPPKSAKPADSATKTPNDAAVSSFFEGLLK